MAWFSPIRGIILGLGDHLSTPDIWGYWSWVCSSQGGPDLGRNMDVQPLSICQYEERVLTHWGRVMHIWVSKLALIGSHNGLSPDLRQAIIWTNAGLLLIGPLGTNFSEILTFSFKKMHLKVSSAKWRPFCLDLNVLKCGLPLSV